MKIYLLYSTLPGKEGYINNHSMHEPSAESDLKYQLGFDHLRKFYTLERAKEEKDCMIRYLTNPDPYESYRKDQGDIDFIRSIEIHEFELKNIIEYETDGGEG